MFDALQRVHYNSRNSPLVTGASFYISEREHIMANKVTIQDIANALGISRNTVSKAINNTGVLADATREKVLKKAAEMGYKQFSYFTAANLDKQEAFVQNSAKAGEIALLTTVFWENLTLYLRLWTHFRGSFPVLATASPCTGSWTGRLRT